MEESKGVYKDVLALHLDYKTNETLTQIMQSLDQSKRQTWRKQIIYIVSLLTDRLKLQENKSKGIEQTDIDAESKLIQVMICQIMQ
jgi:hypothetical protein